MAKMTLAAARVNKGLTQEQLAEKMGVSRQSLYLKIKGVRDFKASEMYCISDILRLTDDEKALIFFGCKLPNTSTNIKGERNYVKGGKD